MLSLGSPNGRWEIRNGRLELGFDQSGHLDEFFDFPLGSWEIRSGWLEAGLVISICQSGHMQAWGLPKSPTATQVVPFFEATCEHPTVIASTSQQSIR